jgi:hypothetical protein
MGIDPGQYLPGNKRPGEIIGAASLKKLASGFSLIIRGANEQHRNFGKAIIGL